MNIEDVAESAIHPFWTQAQVRRSEDKDGFIISLTRKSKGMVKTHCHQFTLPRELVLSEKLSEKLIHRYVSASSRGGALLICQTHPEEAADFPDIKQTLNSASVMDAAHKHAEERGLKKGFGGSGSFPCPVAGCTGQVNYQVSARNGHMAGSCSEGCASWVE